VNVDFIDFKLETNERLKRIEKEIKLLNECAQATMCALELIKGQYKTMYKALNVGAMMPRKKPAKRLSIELPGSKIAKNDYR